MYKTIAISAASLLLLSGVCNAQSLTSKEKAFVDAMAKIVGEKAEGIEKNEDLPAPGGGTYTGIEIQFENDETEVSIARFGSAKDAYAMAEKFVGMSHWADAPNLIEVRGKDLIMIEGALHLGTLAKDARDGAWKNYPWAGATAKSDLLSLSLLDKGQVTRIQKASGELYEQYKDTLAELKDDMAEAEANPDDAEATYTRVGRSGMKVVEEGWVTLVKVTSKAAAVASAPQNADGVLREFAKLIKLELPEAPSSSDSAGAAGPITGLID